MSLVTDAAIALLVSGAAFELCGIIAVAWPDLIDPGRRISAWLRNRYEIIRHRLSRLLGRPRRHTASSGLGVYGLTGHAAGLVHGVREDASLEEKVAFLIRRNELTQERMDEVGARLTAIEEGTPERLEELRFAMERHIAEAIDIAHRAYLPLRIVGAVLLVVGLGSVTAASFV